MSVNCNKKQKTLSEWLEYFENLHDISIDMGLSRVAKVWFILCQKYSISKIASNRVISVSGTNGKGSTCHMLSLLLSKKNKKVGVYSSPHIHSFNERIKINNVSVDDSIVVKAFEVIDSIRQDISLSYFEATTLVGLLIFAWEKVDFAILEVGLGGRLDAVNVIDADASILTSVSLDHKKILGDDLESIALEKAGIFRANSPAIYAHKYIYSKVYEYAKNNHVNLIVNGKDYNINSNKLSFKNNIYELPINLFHMGEHQLQNASAVIVLLDTLKLLPLDYSKKLSCFSLPGRMQLIDNNPDIIVDVAHNEESAITLVKYIKNNSHKGKVYAIVGMLVDKEHKKVLSVFNKVFDKVLFVTTSGKRGLQAERLENIWRGISETTSCSYDSFDESLSILKKEAKINDVIYVFGSFLVASELIKNKVN